MLTVSIRDGYKILQVLPLKWIMYPFLINCYTLIKFLLKSGTCKTFLMCFTLLWVSIAMTLFRLNLTIVPFPNLIGVFTEVSSWIKLDDSLVMWLLHPLLTNHSFDSLLHFCTLNKWGASSKTYICALFDLLW